MSKTKTSYFCQSCGAQAAKWAGKCNSCGEWNTMVEEVIRKETKNDRLQLFSSTKNENHRSNQSVLLQEIGLTEYPRIQVPGQELPRVLGGGVVPGSLVLFGGEPGIGKSTLMLQLALRLKNLRVLYVSGEESEQQIKMRAERIALPGEHCYIFSETNTQNILRQANELQPDLIIVDSVQTLHSSHIESPPGSVSQIRECTGEFQRFAKEVGVPVFLIGHITKDGTIAGPKLLEHIVDTVLQFEGDRNYAYRILRTLKNRFGSTSEIGIYEMLGSGLRQVINPSEILLTHRDEQPSGIAIAAMMEGMRPFLIETQALVSPAFYGTPQRSATGFDVRRMNMLLAVLEKRSGFRFGTKDVFLNIAGGIRVDDPAIDLGVIAALISSYEDVAIPANVCFAAEVGLSGEVRAVGRIEQRIAEADKLGFEKIFVSGYNGKLTDAKKFGIEVITINKIQELVRMLV